MLGGILQSSWSQFFDIADLRKQQPHWSRIQSRSSQLSQETQPKANDEASSSLSSTVGPPNQPPHHPQKTSRACHGVSFTSRPSTPASHQARRAQGAPVHLQRRYSPPSSHATPPALLHPCCNDSPTRLCRCRCPHRHRRTLLDRRDLVRHLEWNMVSCRFTQAAFELRSKRCGSGERAQGVGGAGELPWWGRRIGLLVLSRPLPGLEAAAAVFVRASPAPCITAAPFSGVPGRPSPQQPRQGPAADLLASSTGSSSSTRALFLAPHDRHLSNTALCRPYCHYCQSFAPTWRDRASSPLPLIRS